MRSFRKLNESVDTYISIIVDEGQFYNINDFNDDELYANEPIELRNFKKDCKRKFGKESVREYGAGQFELIITEADFQKFAQLALEYDIEFDIDDIVEF